MNFADAYFLYFTEFSSVIFLNFRLKSIKYYHLRHPKISLRFKKKKLQFLDEYGELELMSAEVNSHNVRVFSYTPHNSALQSGQFIHVLFLCHSNEFPCLNQLPVIA